MNKIKVKVLIFLDLILILSGCAKAARESFVNVMDSLVGHNFNYKKPHDIVNEYEQAKSYNNIITYIKKSDFHIEYDYFQDGCRVGEIFNGELVIIDWYFISDPNRCKLHTNWRGPW